MRKQDTHYMSNYKWLLDAGHGGIHNGHYTTAPAKMHKFPDGITVYEGVINRQITNKLIDKLRAKGIECEKIHDEVDDLSLAVRVARADNAFRRDPRCMFVSIHSNAGGGSGNEVYTSKGQTKSDKVGQIFCDVYKKHFPETKFRNDLADGDDDKESDFYVLRKTDCPALLVENLFFDNRQEAEFLLSEAGQNRIANCLAECIEQTEKLKPI
jgi:N-acetylmuramoyl-L-alanine amidase